MDKVPLLWNGSAAGEISVEEGSADALFSVRCGIREEGLWDVWLVGEGGELRLGVMETARGCGRLRRRFSGQLTAALGRLERGEARPLGRRADWETAENPATLFQTDWLRRELDGVAGALVRRGQRQLALPYDEKAPFPLLPLFCFARVCAIRGRQYVLYRFDAGEQPLFPGEKS